MKRLSFLILLATLVLVQCKKDSSIQMEESLPFENDLVKIESVSTTLPALSKTVYFSNATVGFIGTFDGKLYKTSDGGLSWKLNYTSSTAIYFSQILFKDDLNGYAVGGANGCTGTDCVIPDGVILKTNDGGNTWKSVFEKSNSDFAALAINQTGEVFAISRGTIYKKGNSDTEWSPVYTSTSQLLKIDFTDGVGYCATGDSSILHSTDNGLHWVSTTLSKTYYYTWDIKQKDGTTFCIAGGQFLLKSLDNGESWSRQYMHPSKCHTIQPLSNQRWLIIANGDYSGGCNGYYTTSLLFTQDGGNSWAETAVKSINPSGPSYFYSTYDGYLISGSELAKIAIKPN
jgi:photosystem II stability/assembly factor-like uncharacterized protein